MPVTQMLSTIWKATKFGRPFVIGMIHVPALPGTPKSVLSTDEIMDRVREETQIYADAKIDGIIVENMHDIPYVQEASISPTITAHMTRACMTVNEVLGTSAKDFCRGIQILAAANRHAMAVAQACGFDFIRVECFTFSHIADEGFMSACAGELLRYKRQIGAKNVAIITDLKKKHSSHAVTSDLSLGDVARASEFFLADGLIVTGSSTGLPANPDDIEEVQKHSKLPVFVGSGVTIKNINDFRKADGFIIGSYFKENGDWRNRLVSKKVRNFMQRIRNMKRQ